MTIPEVQALRDEALRTAMYTRQQFGTRSVEYAKAKEALDLYDSELARLRAESSGGAAPTTYATFRND